MEFVTLNNGIKMPMLGYGVYQVTNEECERCVQDALDVGYRSIDTAQAYGNEEAVGRGIKNSGVARDQIFLNSPAIQRWQIRCPDSPALPAPKQCGSDSQIHSQRTYGTKL